MNIIKLLIREKVAISMAEARKIIVGGALRVNGLQVITEEGDNINELELPLVDGDKISISRKKEFIFHENLAN